MKVLNSVAAIYQEILPGYQKLQAKVDNLIRSKKKESWHYFSRLKAEQSYALKLETGRVKDPRRPEDFFACTLVVENLKEIVNATKIIEREFKILYRRPKSDNYTHKESSAFPFDDLRLYLTIIPADYLPSDGIYELIFELQIKTFLQHAWGIATHDLIYKSGNISWARERVAYQVKAMLEQAEVSISGVDQLSMLPELSKESKESRNLNRIMTFLNQVFSKESLPVDLIRLARVVSDLLIYFKFDLNDLRDILSIESDEGRGVKTLNLSPYSVLLQAIINQRRVSFEDFLSAGYYNKSAMLFVPKEIDLTGLRVEEMFRVIRS